MRQEYADETTYGNNSNGSRQQPSYLRGQCKYCPRDLILLRTGRTKTNNMRPQDNVVVALDLLDDGTHPHRSRHPPTSTHHACYFMNSLSQDAIQQITAGKMQQTH